MGGRSVYGVAALIGTAGALFGYDIGVISGVLDFPSFRADFHVSSWTDHPTEKGLVVSTFVAGNLVGALCLAGPAADALGRRTTLVLATAAFVAASALQVFAGTLPVLFAGRAAAGLCIGVLTANTPLFISELAPAAIRGRLVSFNQISMTGGILVAFWMAYSLKDTTHGWRWALGAQVVPALVILAGSPCLPRSPRWLLKRGRTEEARACLLRLRGATRAAAAARVAADAEFAAMERAIRDEQRQRQDTWRFLWTDRVSRRRICLLMVLQVGQQVTGINVVMYFMPFLAQSVGFGVDGSDLLAQGVNGVVNFLSTFLAFFCLDRVGRRPALMAGATIMCLGMATLGTLGMLFAEVEPDGSAVVHNKAAGWAAIVAIYAFVFAFAWSWGPVCWLVPTEALPTAQRAKGVALTTTSNFVFNLLIAQFTPVLREQLRFGLFLVFAGCCLAMLVFVWMLLPETRGRTLEELHSAFAGRPGGSGGSVGRTSDRRRRLLDGIGDEGGADDEEGGGIGGRSGGEVLAPAVLDRAVGDLAREDTFTFTPHKL